MISLCVHFHCWIYSTVSSWVKTFQKMRYLFVVIKIIYTVIFAMKLERFNPFPRWSLLSQLFSSIYLLPLFKPVRSTGPQYRVEVELRTAWRSHSTSREPARLSTPWTMLTESSPRPRDVNSPPSGVPAQPVSFFRSESVVSSSSLGTEQYGLMEQFEEPIKDEVCLYHCVALGLDAMSDAILSDRPISLVDRTRLRTDEIGLPIPTNTAWFIHAIESNIEVS